MSLLEQIEEDKKKLAELEAEENGTNETEGDGEAQDEESTAGNTEDGEASEESGQEDTTQEGGDQESGGGSQEEGDEEKGQKLDNGAYARLRREKAAAERRIKELEAQSIQPQPIQQNSAQEEQEAPDINKDPLAYIQWQNERIAKLEQNIEQEAAQKKEQETYSQAERELMAIEEQFRVGIEDYDDVSAFMAQKVAESIRVLNPRITQQELGQKVKDEILLMSANYYNQGLNPIEELYHAAKEVYGYQPQQQEQTKKEVKPDMKKLANNRKRNAGMAAASGSSGKPEVTREVAANMSMLEFSRLSKAEKQRLLTGE